nr:MAK10-like protein [Tanacetum cinerariifolium]
MEQEITKKQKVDDDKEKANFKQLMETIPDEEEVAIDVIPLAIKCPRILTERSTKKERKFCIPFLLTIMGDETSICTLREYSRPSHEGYRNTIELPEGNNVVPLRSDTIRDFAKRVKAISLPQDVLSISDRHLIKLENQFQLLMEAYLAPKQPIQLNKITFSFEVCNGPHDTQSCMENLEQAFIDYGPRVLTKREMPYKIEQYNSLSDLEREHTKSVYLRNKEDKRRGVKYVISKILGFHKECLELGPEYAIEIADEGEVT